MIPDRAYPRIGTAREHLLINAMNDFQGPELTYVRFQRQLVSLTKKPALCEAG
jgi:hypothetical protein